MDKLNVACKCGKGKLVCLDLINDYYYMGCDTCDNKFTTHYTGYDALCEESEYNNQLNDDIIVLNANGVWVHDATYRKDSDEVSKRVEGFKEIHSIDDGYEVYTYYQRGASFMSVKYNSVHKTRSVYNYRANEGSMEALINHFFASSK